MKIIPYLQHKFALSHEGAVDMAKACASVTVTNIVLMMPATVLYLLIMLTVIIGNIISVHHLD